MARGFVPCVGPLLWTAALWLPGAAGAQSTIPCEETNDCPPRTCLTRTCSQSGYCVYELATRASPQCAGGTAVCVNVAGVETWPCWVNCTPGQVACASATATHVCLPERAWGADEPCPAGMRCVGDACRPVAPPCTNGARECTPDGRGFRTCSNGSWSAPAPCPGGLCRGGACCGCKENDRGCSGDAVQVCEGGTASTCPAWRIAAPCAAGHTCVDGQCVCRPGAATCSSGALYRCESSAWTQVGTCRGEFAWSWAGPLEGWHCTPIVESADPDGWADNHLCSGRNLRFAWSSAGQIAGMRCTQIFEHAEPAGHTWLDNYLCVPANSGVSLRWSQAGPVAGFTCLNVSEPTDPHAWADNYLCANVDCDPRCSAGFECRQKTCRPRCKGCPGGCCETLEPGCCTKCRPASGHCQ